MSTPSPLDLSALEQAALVHAGALRPVDLVLEAINRIDRLNPTLNAVIATDFDRAVAAARDVDPALPFAGVPTLVKDLCTEVAGLPFNEGSAYLRGHVSTRDQEYVARLKRAGLVVLGKTNTPELGMAPTTEPRLHGATRNPWDLARTVGGSSGGSAAAVASGMVPVAHGNDAGGSIRIPASACHLFGLKPTRARNPLGPAYGDAFGGMVAEHVLTRTVRDSAALLDVTSGPMEGDPYWAPPHSGTFLAEAALPPGALRVAVARNPADGRPVHPDCAAVLEEAVSLLSSLGHVVIERELDELTPAVGGAIGRMYGAAVDWAVRWWTRELGRPPGAGELEPLTQLYWDRGGSVSGGELLLAMTTIQEFSRAVAAAYSSFDLWLSPTLATPPPPLGTLAGNEAASAEFVAYPLVVANLTGRAAMNVPMGWSADGLPIGVNVMGAFGGEGMLLRLAAQLEEARPWATVWPPHSARCLEHHHPTEVSG